MTTTPEFSTRTRQEGAWAKPVDRLESSHIPADINLNVDGKHLAGPLRGFGQLWQKTYKIRLSGAQANPEEIIQAWKGHFGEFWPKENHFYAATSQIQAGDVAVLNLAGPGKMTAPGGRGLVATGVLVIYADAESFSFMTPDGHVFGGMITFSAFEEDGAPVAQIQALIRANDPLFELGARLGLVHKMEDDHWHAVLKNLASSFGVQGSVKQTNTLVDPRLLWSQAGNIRHNAALHTGIYLALAPFRWLAGLLHKKA